MDKAELNNKIIEVLKSCFDPEIPVNIFELGLIYEIKIDEADTADEFNVNIQMTLTSPMCPVAESLPPEVEEKIKNIEGVKTCKIQVVWDPPWDKEMMSEAAKLELGIF